MARGKSLEQKQVLQLGAVGDGFPHPRGESPLRAPTYSSALASQARSPRSDEARALPHCSPCTG